MMASYSRIGKSYWTKQDLLGNLFEGGVAPRFFLHLNLFRPPFFEFKFRRLIQFERVNNLIRNPSREKILYRGGGNY